MSTTTERPPLELTGRAKPGTTGSHAVRGAGRIPGVVYGHGAAPLPISIDAKALAEVITSGERAHVLDAVIDGRRDSVLIRAIQRHPVNHRPIHIDLQRVAHGEAITSSVPVVTVGIADGVRNAGGVMDLLAHALDIKGDADKLPEHLSIDVTDLGIGAHILAGAVPLPAGFTLITPPETIVLSIEASRVARAVEEAAQQTAPVSAEPTIPAAG